MALYTCGDQLEAQKTWIPYYVIGDKVVIISSTLDYYSERNYIIELATNRTLKLSEDFLKNHFIPINIHNSIEKTPNTCRHFKKYLNKFNTLEFWYCPDCKEEVK